MIVVVDYGMGNLAAIINMLDYLGFRAKSSRNPEDLARASHLILPGVGAFDRAMRHLRELNLEQRLHEEVLVRGKPILGICLGMQLLGQSSEEGQEAGLGWIPARSVRLSPAQGSGLKVPHIGWSEVEPQKSSDLFAAGDKPRFYFVHSYHMQCDRQDDVAAVCHYGEDFCCAVSQGNINGVQFHPEKSHRFGMALFRRFFGER